MKKRLNNLKFNSMFLNDSYKQFFIKKFINYAIIYTGSNPCSESTPSSNSQSDLALIVKKDLLELGLQVSITEHSYVYGKLEGDPTKDSILFVAHLDIFGFFGETTLRPKIIKDVIQSDGNNVLGGDDKAGIAIIITFLKYLKDNPHIPHGDIEVLFNPDEEIGRGMTFFPKELVKSKIAYTVDGCGLGELHTSCLGYSNFVISFFRQNFPVEDQIKRNYNAIEQISSFIHQIPKEYFGDNGFINITNIEGSFQKALIRMTIGTFSEELLKNFEQTLCILAEKNKGYDGEFDIEIKTFSKNIKYEIDKFPQVRQNLRTAYKMANIEINEFPLRGLTDGSYLANFGIPAPNIFTGAHEIHSKKEYIVISESLKAVEVLINLVTLF